MLAYIPYMDPMGYYINNLANPLSKQTRQDLHTVCPQWPRGISRTTSLSPHAIHPQDVIPY